MAYQLEAMLVVWFITSLLDYIKSKCICIALLHASMSQRASHTPIDLPLNQPKPSRKTRKNSHKNSMHMSTNGCSPGINNQITGRVDQQPTQMFFAV